MASCLQHALNACRNEEQDIEEEDNNDELEAKEEEEKEEEVKNGDTVEEVEIPPLRILQIMRLGFDWDSTDINILLLAKFVKPLMGTSRIVINNIHIKGELLLLLGLFTGCIL
ncbi:hypothetical protein HYC85_016432 [Camellia sinensis]|uniref:Uncharacterized protein n=1 Tax=Camellia sinensis TaxID=4442 RepID=A0A7J7H320_CAMSI|nr:hypothetical protein HYC85_016432 [Camellia sinensis]